MSQASKHIDIEQTIAVIHTANSDFVLNRSLPLCIQREHLLAECYDNDLAPIHRNASHIIGIADAAAIMGVEATDLHNRVMSAVRSGTMAFYARDGKFGVDAGDLRAYCGLCGC